MGGKSKGARLRISLAALAALALPTYANAQDTALDLESRLSGVESRSQLLTQEAPTFQRVQGRNEGPRVPEDVPQRSNIAAARLPVQCLNGATAGSNNVRRILNDVFASGGSTFTSNGPETADGEDDIIVTNTLRYTFTRRSREGLCNRVPDKTAAFDPRWAFVATVQSRGTAYLSDTSGDGSRFSIAMELNNGLFPGRRTFDNNYRTRVGLSLTTATNYSGLYEQWSSNSYDLRASVTHIVQASEGRSLKVIGTVGHTFANRESSEYDIAAIEVQQSIRNFPFENWSTRFGASASWRDYRDADITGLPGLETLEETRYVAALTFTRTIAEDLRLDVGFTFENRSSDAPDREFDAATAPFVIALTRSF